MVGRLGKNYAFVEVDINEATSLEKSLKDVDLVVHAAGPFQQLHKCTVLEAAIKTKDKTAYVDVCDDTSYAFRAKSLKAEAVAANIPAITIAGICPGISNVIAAELVREARNVTKRQPEKLSFSYYIEGTGGTGPTVLAASFLLLGEEDITYNKCNWWKTLLRVKPYISSSLFQKPETDPFSYVSLGTSLGQMVKLKPYSGMLNVDFGKGIQKRDVYLLNLPEVRTGHEVLGVPTVSARFGSAPCFWNWGMEIVTTHLPQEFLKNRTKVEQLVQFVEPIIRAIDGIAGERVSMRVDLECSDGWSTVGILSHKNLSMAVGDATAAFVLAVLEGSTQPGVWFPEEPQGMAIDARELLLRRASQGTFNFILNRPPWIIGKDSH